MSSLEAEEFKFQTTTTIIHQLLNNNLKIDAVCLMMGFFSQRSNREGVEPISSISVASATVNNHWFMLNVLKSMFDSLLERHHHQVAIMVPDNKLDCFEP